MDNDWLEYLDKCNVSYSLMMNDSYRHDVLLSLFDHLCVFVFEYRTYSLEYRCQFELEGQGYFVVSRIEDLFFQKNVKYIQR